MADFKKNYPAIPEATLDPQAMLQTIKALKATIEILTGQTPKSTGGIEDRLVDLKSQAEGRTARFTEYVEVSTAADAALAQRSTTLEARVTVTEDDIDSNTTRISNSEAKITQVETASVDRDNAIAQTATTLEARVTTAEQDIDGNTTLIQQTSATVTNVNTASADRDTALGQRIDAVSASNGQGTAGGKISFIASAGIGEYYASYDLVLTANNALSGLKVVAKDNGGGNISSGIFFTASTFVLYDPNYGYNKVFDYSGGKFRFNVPVEIQGQELAVGAVSTTSFAQTGGDDTNPCRATITTRAGATVSIFADFGGRPNIGYQLGELGVLRLYRKTNGGDFLLTDHTQSYFVAGSGGDIRKFFLYTGLSFLDSPPAGTHEYRVVNLFQLNGPLTIKVTENYR